jgi:hypothetical protein
MKGAIALFFVCLTGTLQAIPIGYTDLGPSRIVFPGNFVHAPLTPMGLDGIPLNGQTISFNVAFTGGHFVRAFTDTKELGIDIRLPLNGTVPFPADYTGLAAGSGYFLNAKGHRVGKAEPLTADFEAFSFPFFVDDVVIFGSLSPNTRRPLDLYGFHFDFALSLPGAQIEETGPFSRFESVEILPGGPHFKNAIFGIGPDIPTDFVPDGGGTLQLAAIALTALVGFRRGCIAASGT